MNNKATSLGSLERLFPEIRYMIYANCHAFSEEPRSAQMLRVNTKAYAEYLKSLQPVWKFGAMRLHIDPSKHPSTVQILTEYRRTIGSINAASPHLHFDINPFRNMPIGRYVAIDVVVDAPNPKDPGQTIRLCKQVSAMVTSLSPCWFPSTAIGIPSRTTDFLFPQQMKVSPSEVTRLYVVFAESPGRSWRTNGKFNKTLPDYDEGWYDERLAYTREHNTDVGLVLQMMARLRNAPVRGIDRPIEQGNMGKRLTQLMSNVYTLSQVQTPFGLSWRQRCLKPLKKRPCILPYPKSTDHEILEKIQSIEIWHEYLLDDLPGRSANLLRQERFLNWCGAYERQHGTALHGIPSRLLSEDDPFPKRPDMSLAGAHEWIYIDLWEFIKSSFHSRFWAMMSCDANKPGGIERKSKNKLRTEFRERPMIDVLAFLGFCVSLGETYAKGRKWNQATTDCIVCRAEAERNRKVFAQSSVQGMIHELSSRSGFDD